ncbi:MAG: hypothetical protein ACK4F9_06505 [Brevinematia bacterium]
MKKFIFIVLSFVLASYISFGAVKFKGDLISVGDFKYMQSNYVYNNVSTDPYFGLDNVEFIVNFGTKLELTSEVYGLANLIVQPTTKFKHIAVDNLMINYFHKASKVKIIPFYRYRSVRFDDPENIIGWFNSWVISSSVFGISNVLDSKVDNNGFYTDSSYVARVGGIPYLLRPVEFFDGSIISMPGMGEDTTNLSLVGRDAGGFYAEQKTSGYLWQIFLGAYFIDGSESPLNLSGAANVKFSVLEFSDVQFWAGIDGMIHSFGNNYKQINSYDVLNIYRIGIIPDKGFKFLQNLDVYGIVSHELLSLFVKGGIVNQSDILSTSSSPFYSYNTNMRANGFRFSGGVFSDFIPGLKVQLGGEYLSLSVYTNSNAYYDSGRIAGNAKVYGEYELEFGGISKFVLEGSFVQETLLNSLNSFIIDIPGVSFPAQGRVSLNNAIGVKGGIDLKDVFEFLGLSVVGSYQSISIKPEEYTSIKSMYTVNIIEARGILDVSFDFIGFEGVGVGLGGKYLSWNDNMYTSRLLLNILNQTQDLVLTYVIPIGFVYYKTDNVIFRVGYGYPIFGDVYDIDFGLTSDALNNYLYKNSNNKFEGLYAEYVLQNLPRLYIDLRISF